MLLGQIFPLVGIIPLAGSILIVGMMFGITLLVGIIIHVIGQILPLQLMLIQVKYLMREKYNFKIESSDKTLLIEVPLSIFPPAVVLRTAYHFIEQANVIVGEAKENKIAVTLIFKKDSLSEPDLEELAYEFNLQLISCSVEEEESRKHASARDAMMRAALSSPPSGFRPPPPAGPPPNKQ